MAAAAPVFTESILVLPLGVPLAFVELLSDANTAFDRSAHQVIQPLVTNTYTTVTGRRRRTTHYHVVLKNTDMTAPVPTHVEVLNGVFLALAGPQLAGRDAITRS